MQSASTLIRGLRELRSLSYRASTLVSSRTYSSTSTDVVVVQMHSPQVAEFVLNQPKKLNSLDTPMIDAMVRELKKWKSSNTQPHALLVSGAGGKAFCAGGDIVSIYKLKDKVDDIQERAKFFYKEYLLDHQLATTQSTEIALWNGIVMGGGVGISMQAPIRIATQKSVFAMPEATIGFFCDVGGSYFLPRILNNPAYGLYLGLSSERFKGKELLAYGVATHFIHSDALDALRSDLSSNVTQKSTKADILTIVNKHCSTQGFEGLDAKKSQEIQSVYKLDSCEAIVERAKKLAEEGNEVAKRAVKTFPRMSPLAMKIIFEQIKRGASMSYSECMKMEYDIAQACMDEKVSDFFQGVRALLVDKDNKPKWHYQNLEDISVETVNKFFEAKAHKLNLELLKYQQ